jgi:tetratricopeptide (TPR) repeat protein
VFLDNAVQRKQRILPPAVVRYFSGFSIGEIVRLDWIGGGYASGGVAIPELLINDLPVIVNVYSSDKIAFFIPILIGTINILSLDRLSMSPNINALIDQAEQYFQAGNFEEAKKKLTYVLNAQPENLDALEILGIICANSGELPQAIKHFEKITELEPDYAEAWSNHGLTLQELKQYDQALASYDKAISLKPDYAGAWYNRGNALQELKQYAKALASYDKAISLKPDFAEAWSNRGVTLQDLKQHGQALASYDKAISLKPNYAGYFWNKSQVQLLTSDFQGGWTNYEYRWLCRQNIYNKPHQNIPSLTSLSNLQSSTVLVWWEQGLGDTIQFSRYVTLLANLGANVVFDVQAPLKSLLKHSFPGIKIITRDEAVSGIDFQIPLMSLPLVFKTELKTIPSSASYLKSDPLKVENWKTKLPPGNKLKVGLVWNGGLIPNHPELWGVNERRNIPIKVISNGLREVDVVFYSLQKGDPAESEIKGHELKYFPNGNFVNFADRLFDFTDTAALIENLDLVIGVDTSTTHLSAALGKPTWLLNRSDTCWRWLLDRQDSPWYPSVKIFRQPKAGDWESVIQDVISDLKLLS